MRKILSALLIAGLMATPAFGATKLSQIASGGALSPSTDTMVAVRSGTTDVLVTPPAQLTTPNSTLTFGGTATNPTVDVANQAANTLLGALTSTFPTGISVPSCVAAGKALNWTSGTGFTCNSSIAAANGINSLTTTGSSGAATYSGGVLNIPQYSGGGSVSVTSSSNDLVVNPSPGTGTFTVGNTQVINPQANTASYTYVASDMGKTVTQNGAATKAYTLPQATTTGFGAGVSFTDVNTGTGVVTITPTTSTINGLASITLGQYQGAYIISDGTNYTAYLSSSVTFPSNGNIVVSAGPSAAPTGLAEVDGDCVVGAGGAWGVGSCAGSSSSNLGTAVGAASPQITGDATSGLYTAGAGKVDVGISNNKISEWSSTGHALTGIETITSTSAAALTVGANGATNPALTIDASTASSVTGLSIKSAVTGGNTIVSSLDTGSNSSVTLESKGTGNLDLYAGSGFTGTVHIEGAAADMGTTSSGGAVIGFNTNGKQIAFTPVALASGVTNHFLYTEPTGDSGLTASTESNIEFWNNAAAGRTHATGALALQRDFLINGATDLFAAASTLTNGATLAIDNKSCGTNGTCTNESAIYSATKALTGTITNSYKVNLTADTGATNNYAAQFLGDVTLGASGSVPVVSSCGSGALVTGSTDNKGQISGVTAATACTITFAYPLSAAPACMFNTNSAIVPTISTISTAAVTTTMTALTGTLYYHCF